LTLFSLYNFEILCLKNSFHGRTYAAISASGKSKLTEGFEPVLNGFKQVAFNDSKAVSRSVDKETAAIMIETVQGEGGITPAKKEYLRDIQKIANDNNLLLFFDEVQCGVGRTGKFLATEWVKELKPNIVAVAKGIGGGFPTIYPDLIPQSLGSYFNEINKSLENLKLEKLPEIICEPGRAIVAESGSTVVRVNLRKKQKLYINDGTYGTLFDAGTPNIVFPSRMIKENSNKIISKKLTAFDFFGPTCDSMDYMKGPFLLPNNIKENDYIELGQLGAYGLTFRTQFNGYYSNEIYEVEDNPIMTMYDKDINKANMVA